MIDPSAQASARASAHRTVFAVDCDRTLTESDLVPDARAIAAIADLRREGIRCILVTGRAKADLMRHESIATAFDAYAFEGGAEWGTWSDLSRPSNVDVVLKAAHQVAAAGVAVERRSASFSVALADQAVVATLCGDCSMQVNVDRIDVLPPRLDKGTGLDGALGALGLRGAHVVAIGDGQNDIPLFERAHIGLAVANAADRLKAVADEVLSAPGPAGVVDAAKRLLAGEWRDAPAPAPTAA